MGIAGAVPDRGRVNPTLPALLLLALPLPTPPQPLPLLLLGRAPASALTGPTDKTTPAAVDAIEAGFERIALSFASGVAATAAAAAAVVDFAVVDVAAAVAETREGTTSVTVFFGEILTGMAA